MVILDMHSLCMETVGEVVNKDMIEFTQITVSIPLIKTVVAKLHNQICRPYERIMYISRAMQHDQEPMYNNVVHWFRAAAEIVHGRLAVGMHHLNICRWNHL